MIRIGYGIYTFMFQLGMELNSVMSQFLRWETVFGESTSALLR
jgi:hypothetical protein